ncbi:solute carrier family 35 member F2-like isoform X1 [Conger conger]|uniref:solute carrier family 35 member F2-like isoform X1 n=1 Tax=Conger conger TaxID=82655 RepID=UPI002A5A8750|nr:solute carrier family 35 member F2-like isoform X1 [Conger conger]
MALGGNDLHRYSILEIKSNKKEMEGNEGLRYTAHIDTVSEYNGMNRSSHDSDTSCCNSRTRLLQKKKRMESGEHVEAYVSHRSRSSLFTSYSLRDVFTWHLLKVIAMGQALSMLICGTAVTCQYLADRKVETPMLQSFVNYVLLFLTYTIRLAFRKGDENILQILKAKWWKYLLLGFADVEANYTVVMAYQFTTLTSIQLLDCFVIPVLMVLSWVFLKTRFRVVHYVAVALCLLGVGAMVGADLLAGRDQGSTSSVLLGDGLVLISAALYAVSNVCQEYTVKNLSRIEFLGMVGLFGTLISGIQLAVLEHNAVAAIKWDLTVVLLFAIYGLCMFALYSFMPVVIKLSSATAVNLSLLTADLFSLFCGLYLFHYTFSGLYILSFVVITVGFIGFNAVPTLAPVDGSSEGGSEDPSDVDEQEAVKHAATLEVPSETDDGGEESECLQMQRSQSERTTCTADKSSWM